jgi:hypothetical protein
LVYWVSIIILQVFSYGIPITLTGLLQSWGYSWAIILGILFGYAGVAFGFGSYFHLFEYSTKARNRLIYQINRFIYNIERIFRHATTRAAIATEEPLALINVSSAIQDDIRTSGDTGNTKYYSASDKSYNPIN